MFVDSVIIPPINLGSLVALLVPLAVFATSFSFLALAHGPSPSSPLPGRQHFSIVCPVLLQFMHVSLLEPGLFLLLIAAFASSIAAALIVNLFFCAS
jgi:hypothetical protein